MCIRDRAWSVSTQISPPWQHTAVATTLARGAPPASPSSAAPGSSLHRRSAPLQEAAVLAAPQVARATHQWARAAQQPPAAASRHAAATFLRDLASLPGIPALTRLRRTPQAVQCTQADTATASAYA
eukprot:11267993-Alexandrium_andersonii.AAC.1